jgi:hypothetical protein
MKRTLGASRMVRLGLAVALVALALLAALPVIPPNPAPASTPRAPSRQGGLWKISM